MYRYYITWKRIQDGGDKNVHPTSFPPVTSTNVGMSPKNLLTFSFNPFATLVLNFKSKPSASLKLLNLNEKHPSKYPSHPSTTPKSYILNRVNIPSYTDFENQR